MSALGNSASTKKIRGVSHTFGIDLSVVGFTMEKTKQQLLLG